MVLTKQAVPTVAPQSSATRNSFHRIRKTSDGSISPTDILRIMVTEVCPPAFPPVSISMGTKTVSIGSADSAPSKCPRIVEVKVADTISSNSHGMRLDHVSRTPV